MPMIVTPVSELEQALRDMLERRQATSDQGCSALANVLLASLVKCLRDPRISAHVADEMRRLAAVLVDFAGKDAPTIEALPKMQLH